MKRLICIECPKGCALSVDLADGKVKHVRGAGCPKGIAYAAAEIESPTRILTSTVRADDLSISLIPARTNKPIPRKDIPRAMAEIHRLKITRPVKAGDALVDDFLGLGVRLIATREAFAIERR